MRKNLQHIQLDKSPKSKVESIVQNTLFCTPEGIELQATYSEASIENLEHLGFGAGFAPYLRGTQTTMYINQAWKKQKFLRIDSANENPFENISLEKKAVAIALNNTALTSIAHYICTAEQQAIPPEQLSGILEINVLEKINSKDATNSSTANSIKIATAILEYTNQKMPKFNSVSISGFQLHEAGATADMELAYTLAYGLEYIRAGILSGIKIDVLVSQLQFTFGVGMNHFIEIAKLRAARMIWAKLILQFNPKESKSLALQIHCETSLSNLTQHDLQNNNSRTCIEALAAILGGTASLHTDPSSKNTQTYLQEETKITKTVDPWAGSFYVESLTYELVQKTWQRLEEIEAFGGMTKAIDTGIPKQTIEEASGKKEVIQPTQNIDTQLQGNSLDSISLHRNTEKVALSLKKLNNCILTEKSDLLETIVEAMKNGANPNEINAVLSVFIQ